MSYRYEFALRERIGANCAAFERRVIEDSERRAATAIALVDDAGEAGYLFIRRALTMRRNPGQYALPGGRAEPGESAEHTARRELAEELGVDLGPETVLGVLDDLPTRAGGVVTPVVLWAGGAVTMALDPDEVHDAWVRPVAELDHPEAPRRVTLDGVEGQVLRMPVGGEWINPPTAAMLYQFREVGLHGRTVRVHDVASPLWTAK
ncbi:MAG: CoA pyrophosphatase [Acidimicrobiia bacterium]|nr:CoA pyrophosphatase [Acidimicrobiia bacterium]